MGDRNLWAEGVAGDRTAGLGGLCEGTSRWGTETPGLEGTMGLGSPGWEAQRAPGRVTGTSPRGWGTQGPPDRDRRVPGFRRERRPQRARC